MTVRKSAYISGGTYTAGTDWSAQFDSTIAQLSIQEPDLGAGIGVHARLSVKYSDTAWTPITLYVVASVGNPLQIAIGGDRYEYSASGANSINLPPGWNEIRVSRSQGPISVVGVPIEPTSGTGQTDLGGTNPPASTGA